MAPLPSLDGRGGRFFSKVTIECVCMYNGRHCGVLWNLQVDETVEKNNQTETNTEKN